jgi:hypothetical protein
MYGQAEITFHLCLLPSILLTRKGGVFARLLENQQSFMLLGVLLQHSDRSDHRQSSRMHNKRTRFVTFAAQEMLIRGYYDLDRHA